MYRNNLLMLILTALSIFFLVTLTGLYFYSGTILPSVPRSDPSGALLMWLTWVVVAGTPLVTALLWIIRLRADEGD